MPVYGRLRKKNDKTLCAGLKPRETLKFSCQQNTLRLGIEINMKVRRMNLLRKLFFFAGSLIFAPAQARCGATQISIGSGATVFHGDLSSQAAAVSYGALLRETGSKPDDAAKVSWFTGFEIFSSETTHDGSRFPFVEQARLSLLGFFISPGLCLGLDLTDICGALGIGTLNVNSRNNRQDYGTWNYQIDAKYWLSERFFGQIAAKKIGDVEQTVGGRASLFWLTTFVLSAGFQL